MQKKLPVWRVVRETYNYLGDHGGKMLAAAPQLAAILFVGTCVSLHLSYLAQVQHSLLLESAGWLVGMVGPVLSAVAWHRYILLNETPRGGLTVGRPERMYFMVAAGSGALMFTVSLISAVTLALAKGPDGVHILILLPVAVLQWVPLYFLGHVFLALPQAALTGKVDLRGIHALTRGNKWRFLAVALLPAMPLLVVLELFRAFVLQMPHQASFAYYLYSSTLMLISSLVVVTTMSVTYRTLVLTPDEDAPAAPADETVSVQG